MPHRTETLDNCCKYGDFTKPKDRIASGRLQVSNAADGTAISELTN